MMLHKIDGKAVEPLSGDAIVIRLNPHLLVLSEGFALPKLARANGQLGLFPALPVDKPRAPAHILCPPMGHAEERRRRLA